MSPVTIHQAHFRLVDLDLEPEHLAQESGGGRKIDDLQVGRQLKNSVIATC